MVSTIAEALVNYEKYLTESLVKLNGCVGHSSPGGFKGIKEMEREFDSSPSLEAYFRVSLTLDRLAEVLGFAPGEASDIETRVLAELNSVTADEATKE